MPRLYKALRQAGLVINKKKVRRLMRQHGMAGRFRRPTCRTTFPGPDGYQIPDLVDRRFASGAADAAWCQDITYLPTREGWLYLASVLDLGSRRLIGYSMAEHMRTELVLDALGMAIARAAETTRWPVSSLTPTGDHWYTANDYIDFCHHRHMRPSVGRTGVCWDNAVAESFWESLKRECLPGRVFATRAEARRAIFRWNNWYNTSPLHSTLNDVAPLRVGTAVPSSVITTRPADGEMPSVTDVVPSTDSWSAPSIGFAAAMTPDEVLEALRSRSSGLTSVEVSARAEAFGPNAVRSHHASAWSVLSRQLHSPLLWLLLAAAAVSGVVGEGLDALIIGVIVGASVGLGFVNEYRAERAAEAMHSEIRHDVASTRDDESVSVEVTHLVPGDIVHLGVGSIVPADVRLLAASNLECDESILTGESVPAEKSPDPTATGAPLAELSSCLFMGTVVHEGAADAVVVATGAATQFGRIAVGLGEHHPQTEFQLGLTRFSGLLAKVGGVLSVTIFVINVALGRPVIDAVLFSLAVAVGITPQLLPAVVSTSLAIGSRRLADKKVLVKRLVCIEDLGDIDMLFTDKTGTLTDGHISFAEAIDPAGDKNPEVLTLGLVCNEATRTGDTAVGGNPLDVALWEAPGATASPTPEFRRVAIAPFDHDRRCVSVLADRSGLRLLITKGAPEAVLDRCTNIPDSAHRVLAAQFSAGKRVVAIATRVAPELTALAVHDEHDLTLTGFLVFVDQPKPSAAASIARLAELGITVKIVTGDNPLVAETVCRTLGVPSGGTLTGADLDTLDDGQLNSVVNDTTIFARVSPEQKARILRAQRDAGSAVAFLGDGVNDALALHHADVGISVDSATDVAKDAADIILLERDLDVLADGVAEGRRIFANTVKYVLMGTSSNFGNMFSVTVAAAFLPFLPMLPFQILLNNLLYDSSQMTIPTDRVDEEQLARPSHWDIGFIRRFMIRFGPISSVFDFATFAVMLWVFDAAAPEFRSGWFVESLATQTLIVFVIRTRRVPFLRSRPSRPLLTSVVAVVMIGALIPQSPLNDTLGFAPLPAPFFGVLVAFVVAYLACVEVAKYFFYKVHAPTTPQTLRRGYGHRVHRLADRWSHHERLAPSVHMASPNR